MFEIYSTERRGLVWGTIVSILGVDQDEGGESRLLRTTVASLTQI